MGADIDDGRRGIVLPDQVKGHFGTRDKGGLVGIIFDDLAVVVVEILGVRVVEIAVVRVAEPLGRAVAPVMYISGRSSGRIRDRRIINVVIPAVENDQIRVLILPDRGTHLIGDMAFIGRVVGEPVVGARFLELGTHRRARPGVIAVVHTVFFADEFDRPLHHFLVHARKTLVDKILAVDIAPRALKGRAVGFDNIAPALHTAVAEGDHGLAVPCPIECKLIHQMIPFIGGDLVIEAEPIAIIGIEPAVVSDRVDVGVGGVRGIVGVAVPFDEALRIVAGDVVDVAECVRLIPVQVDQRVGGEATGQAHAVVEVARRR